MDAIIKKLNQRFALVKFSNKIRIWDGESFLTKEDFITLLLPDKKFAEGEKPIPVATLWLNSRDRRQYEGVIFDPGETPEGYLNLYEGLAVEPKKGKWGLFEDHIHENVCKGRTDYYSWLVSWMAHIVQHPGIKIGTSVVIRGGKGTGKGMFAETFGRLFGRYFTTLNSSDHVTSKFNAVYSKCILMCADEAVWAGDKKAEGTLKNLITAEKLYTVYKGYEGFYQKNFTHFIFTTNNQWAVPASEDERRYFVLDIGKGWQKNYKMFAAMLQQMESGGYAAMLYDLLNIKIKENLREPPRTDALQDQINLSEPLHKQFWRERVTDSNPEDWPKEVKKDGLYNEFVDYCNTRKARRIISKAQFFKELKIWCEYKMTRKIDPVERGDRIHYIMLPEYKVCVKGLKNS